MPIEVLIIISAILIFFGIFGILVLIMDKEKSPALLFWIPSIILIIWISLSCTNRGSSLRLVDVYKVENREICIIDNNIINLTTTFSRIIDKETVYIKVWKRISYGIMFPPAYELCEGNPISNEEYIK